MGKRHSNPSNRSHPPLAGKKCPCYRHAHRNITVNYTVALGPEPDVTSSAINCHSSFVLQEAYARDKILQDELAELEKKRSEYAKYTKLILYWEHILNMSTPFESRTTPVSPRLHPHTRCRVPQESSSSPPSHCLLRPHLRRSRELHRRLHN